MTAKRFVYPSIGSVSSGTMRTEDLLDTFAGELRHHMRRMRLTREQRKRFNQLARDYERAEFDWDSNECTLDSDTFDAGELLGEFFDALDEIAPPYAYFGAVDGDGADYGFWPCLGMGGDTDDLPRLTAGDEIPREHWGEDVLLVNDHGNVECGYVDRKGKFHEYWSVV